MEEIWSLKDPHKVQISADGDECLVTAVKVVKLRKNTAESNITKNLYQFRFKL